MFSIAVVEDDDRDAEVLDHCLTRYAQQNDLEFQIHRFADAASFLKTYHSDCDLILMDIDLPAMSGMDAAREIRRIDRSVTLVFVTRMAQYAVEGYAVEAFDYILKPINDYSLNLKLPRILAHVGAQTGDRIMIRTDRETIGLQLRKIWYVEADGHYVNWHTADRVYRSLGTLKAVEQQLPDSFCTISRWHVVNMQYVRSVMGDEALIGDRQLHIGRSYKQSFLKAYAGYMVGGV